MALLTPDPPRSTLQPPVPQTTRKVPIVMANNITLSAGVRQNLLALQNTASLLGITQNRLATGKKVNSALDNPTSFFTSSALSSRASDLSKLLDSMANGINTVKAAD